MSVSTKVIFQFIIALSIFLQTWGITAARDISKQIVDIQKRFEEQPLGQLTNKVYLPFTTGSNASETPVEVLVNAPKDELLLATTIKPSLETVVLRSPDSNRTVELIGEVLTETLHVDLYVPHTTPPVPPYLKQAGASLGLRATSDTRGNIFEFPNLVSTTEATEDTPAQSEITPTLTITFSLQANEIKEIKWDEVSLYQLSENNTWQAVPSYGLLSENEFLVVGQPEKTGVFAVFAPPTTGMFARSAAPANLKVVLDPDDDIGWSTVNGVRITELPLAYRLSTALKQKFADNLCTVDILITRTDAQKTVARSTRAAAARNFGGKVYVTLAFNALLGSRYWGVRTDGGVNVWTRSNASATDNSLASELRGNIRDYTGRPATQAVRNSIYPDLDNRSVLPADMAYAHIETLFLDHNYDRPVIDSGFNNIVNGVYAGLLKSTSFSGVLCGAKPPVLPAPPSAEELQRLRNLGYQNFLKYGADPVNFSTGSHISQVPVFRLPARGGSDLSLTLTYNSQDSRDNRFGYGWSASLGGHLQRYSDESVLITMGDGRSFYFKQNGTAYQSANGSLDRLERITNGWRFTAQSNAYSLTFTEALSGVGLLSVMQDNNGNQLTYSYDMSGQDKWRSYEAVPRPPLTRIQTGAGQWVNFQNNTDGRVTQVAVSDGRSYNLTYTNGDLTQIADGKGNPRKFQYNSQHFLTHAWDTAGILYLQNTYDSAGRVTGQIDALGARYIISYDLTNRVTTYTDALGKAKKYFYDEQKRVTSVQDATGATVRYEYDANYNITKFTDARGAVTLFAYDTRGNMIQRTEPNSIVTKWAYDASNRVASVTDANGATTTIQRDARGNITQINKPNVTNIRFVYDSFGQATQIANENGKVTTQSYDSFGNVTKIVDPLLGAIEYGYDNAGRRIKMTDAKLRSVSFAYDANDNVAEITDPVGKKTSFVYDKNNLLIKFTNRRGFSVEYTYDNNLKLLSVKDEEGYKVTYAYDAMMNRISSTDRRGAVTRFTYDDLYRLAVVTGPENHTSRMMYDANGNLVQFTDSLGFFTKFEFDALNRKTKETDALNGVTIFTYTPVGQVASVTNPRNAVTKYQYDVVGRVTTVTDALQGKASFVYDNVGNVTGVTNANGKTSTRAYDANNRVTRIVDEMSFATDIMYDAVGNVTATKNPRGAITSIEYDAKDNPIKVTDALLNTALFEYDAEDNVTKTTDPNGFATTLEYSPRNLVTKVIEAGNQITTRTYDANRNVLSVTNANGNTTTYTYNPRNLLVKLENPLQKMQMQYDGLGQMTRRINGNGVTTRRDFDALGRLTGVVENEKAGVVADSQTNVTTLYRYDAVSNLVKIIDARNKETSFVYDLLNRQTKETNSLGNSWEYGFDAIGNMVTRKDARGNVTQFAYTANNLLAKKSYPNNTSVTFAYDATGNQTSMTDALGTTKNEFDLLNRITSSTNHAGQKVSYTYDKAGNRTSITYPNAKIQKFEFDNTNYVKAMIDGEGNRFDITRNALHSVTKIAYPNQTQASYTFDKAERLTSVSNTKNSGEVIANFVYTLDANDNRTQTVHTQDGKVNTKSYVYDAINRLVKSSDTQGNTTSYVFDATGNRVSMTGNTDPVTQKRVASYSSQATYNNINAITALTTQVSKPGLGTDQLDKVGKSLNAFINGVEAQKGKHIDAALADELLTLAKQIVELLGQGESIDPALIASGIAALKSKVEAGISSGKINNAGTGNSLLVKLKDAENDNAPSNKNFITTTTFEQDANGNRTSQTVDKQKVEYTYGYEDELLQVSNLQVLGNGKFNTKDKTTNTFDGYGRLYKRAFDWNNGGGQGSQTSSTYVYDGLDPIADYLSGTTEQTNYYRVLGKIISVKNSTSDVQYMHHDGLNSVVALSTKTGLVGESNLYGDYGALSESNSKSRNRFTYTGQEYDKNTGLLHFYAREYDPVTGTWLQQDKYRGQLNDPMSLHRYGYVSNNPTNLVDPYGNCPICVGVFIGVGIGIVYGLMNPKVVSAPPSDPVQQEKHQEEINKRKEEIANSTFNKVTGANDFINGMDKLEKGDASGIVDVVLNAPPTPGGVGVKSAGKGVWNAAKGIASRLKGFADDAGRYFVKNGAEEVAEKVSKDGLEALASKTVKISEDIWNKSPFERGNLIDKGLGNNLSRTFPIIDKWDPLNKTVTSIKSIDLNAKTYQDVNVLKSKVQGYIKDVKGFSGADYGGMSVQNFGNNVFNKKTLELAVPKTSNQATIDTLSNLVKNAKSQGVDLKIIIVE